MKKTPRKILILAQNIEFQPEISSQIDYQPRDVVYDLVIFVNDVFRLHVENHPFSIANSEIWFERGNTLTKNIFERGMVHYSECEIRNGS